jgi:hypothetical protein
MTLLDGLQWPAMLVTVAAAWFVGSSRPTRRIAGFWLFLLSNLLWIIWGASTHAWALVILQVCLAATNVRGEKKNAAEQRTPCT